MMITKPTTTTLYQVIKLVGDGFDISDEVFDWVNYFGVDDTADDYYNKCMLLFACNIEIVKYQPNWFTICKITDFINNNKSAFNRFMDEENRAGYRPKDYEQDFTDDDEEFYDLYIMTFECLINGDYSDKEYEKLYNYLTSERGEK